MSNQLAAAVNDWCKTNDATSEDLATLSGVPLATVKRIRQGTTDNPYLDTAVSLAKAMGCSLDEIIGIKSLASIDVPDAVANNDRAQLIDSVRRLLLHSHAHSIRLHEQTESATKSYRRLLGWVLGFSLVINIAFMFLLVWDITHPNMGWIQYDAAMMNVSQVLTYVACALLPGLRSA